MECLEVTPEPVSIVPEPQQTDVITEAWFQCRECKSERVWGNAEPADRRYQPLLRCAACQLETRHVFRAMDSGEWQDYAAKIWKEQPNDRRIEANY